jgi:hypothetical protein
LENNTIILDLVKRYFSLDERSINIFDKELSNRFIDDVYQNFGLDNQRKRIVIPKEKYEDFDQGWYYFKIYFDKFYSENKITYEDFISGKIGSRRLADEVASFYDDEPYVFDKSMKIGKVRLPKNKTLYLVLSCNFADWFLCSTAESWHSCLDLNSSYQSAYWANLPGLIIDKNRAMIYITDGTKKYYRGITVDKFISRTWVLLNDTNSICSVKEYPLGIMSGKMLNETFDTKIKCINFDFVSKYPLDFLYTKNGISIFPYLDRAKIKSIDKKYFIIGTNGGYGGSYGYKSDGSPFDGSQYNYENGLDDLIKENKEIINFCGIQYSCEECGIGLVEEDVHFGKNNETYCSSCFDELHPQL